MKFMILGVAVAAALLSTSVSAQEAAAPAPAAAAPTEAAYVESPVWLPREKPKGSLYPPKAMEKRMAGTAEVTCTVNDKGRLEKCQIDSETPAGYGFGKALVEITKLMRMKPLDEDGAPVAGKLVTVPFEFKLE